MADQSSNRRRIKTLVSLLPGLHLRALQRLIGLSFSSTRYHVQELAKTGQIVRSDERGYSRLYPVGISESDKILFSTLQAPTDRRILTYLVKSESVTFGELCEQTGLAKSTLSEHLARLVRIGIVTSNAANAQGLEYEVSDRVRVEGLVKVHNLTLRMKAADRFIDLWDF